VGDLALVGRPVHARVLAVKSGHALNHKLAREILEYAKRQDHAGSALTTPAMDIRKILGLLPHRYPMVLIDRVIEIDSDQRAVGVKNVTINEPFFQGHYPAAPIMPGVLIVEAMCQLSGLMLSQKLERTGKIAVLLSLDRVKLRKAVTPGDQLVIETEAVRTSARFGDVQARAYVAADLAAEARIKFMMVDAEQPL
jgi:UDP-3-O-[3-hydroxymyristoyl] N-acetylglucosamine deacetylase/3-hydroxyacyl-[acyl-carrier-protein] dehydratase